MYRLLLLISTLISLSTASADTNQESFQNCADGFKSQDCNHINEADERFGILEGEQAVQNDRLDGLESHPTNFRWSLWKEDLNAGTYEQIPDAIVVDETASQSGLKLLRMRIDTYDGEKVWIPAMFSSGRHSVWPGKQGIDSQFYALAYPANSGCVGTPLGMVSLLPPGTKADLAGNGNWDNLPGHRQRIAYNPIDNKVYAAGPFPFPRPNRPNYSVPSDYLLWGYGALYVPPTQSDPASTWDYPHPRSCVQNITLTNDSPIARPTGSSTGAIPIADWPHQGLWPYVDESVTMWLTWDTY